MMMVLSDMSCVASARLVQHFDSWQQSSASSRVCSLPQINVATLYRCFCEGLAVGREQVEGRGASHVACHLGG